MSRVLIQQYLNHLSDLRRVSATDREMVRPDHDRLNGTVEVNETFFGGPKPGKRGRGAAGKALILVVVPWEASR